MPTPSNTNMRAADVHSHDPVGFNAKLAEQMEQTKRFIEWCKRRDEEMKTPQWWANYHAECRKAVRDRKWKAKADAGFWKLNDDEQHDADIERSDYWSYEGERDGNSI